MSFVDLMTIDRKPKPENYDDIELKVGKIISSTKYQVIDGTIFLPPLVYDRILIAVSDYLESRGCYENVKNVSFKGIRIAKIKRGRAMTKDYLREESGDDKEVEKKKKLNDKSEEVNDEENLDEDTKETGLILG